MSQTASLILRAIVAVLLIAFFYGFALAGAAGLAWVGWLLLQALTGVKHVSTELLIFGVVIAFTCEAAAVLIVFGLLPRRRRFEPPGPELDAAAEPALFAEIRRIAERTGQTAPAHVYVMPQVNAFVTERGGLMGLRSERVMGIGLPLFAVLSVAELRAVLTHELGHFYGGDTKVGPWIYATRRALARTLENLGWAHGLLGKDRFSTTAKAILVVVMGPFDALGRVILRVTEAISRAQELSADALAARTVSGKAVADGLTKVHQASLAFAPFFDGEVAPLLRAGRLPPLAAGFRAFLQAESVSGAVSNATREELAAGKANAYDSHPPLKERVEHALSLPCQGTDEDPRPAAELLAAVERLEAQLAAGWVEGPPLQPVSWEDSVTAFTPGWHKAREACGRALAGVTIAAIPRATLSLKELAERVTGGPVSASEAGLRDFALRLLGSALCDVLLEAGFTARSLPGEPLRLTRDGTTVEPMKLLKRYLDGELPPEEWSKQWASLGVDGAQIGRPATPQPSGAAA